jgi:hypothetical protein
MCPGLVISLFGEERDALVLMRGEFGNADEDSQRRRPEIIFASEIVGVKNGLEG